MIRIQNKDYVVDLKSAGADGQVQISERRGNKSLVVPTAALAQLIDSLNDAMDIVVGEKGGTTKSKTASAPPSELNVFVGGLSKEASESDIVAFMSSAGEVVSVKVKKGKKAKVNSAVVEFSSVEGAKKAISTLNDIEFMGFTIKCKEDQVVGGQATARATPAIDLAAAQKKKEAADAKKQKKKAIADIPQADKVADEFKIYCLNLPFDATVEDLEEFFSAAGKVKSVDMRSNKKGRNFGYATIEFEEAASVYTSIGQLNGQILMGRDLKVREYFVQ